MRYNILSPQSFLRDRVKKSETIEPNPSLFADAPFQTSIVLFKLWQQMFKLGDLNTIRNMNRFEFAQRMGHREMGSEAMLESDSDIASIGFKGLPFMFYLDKTTWQVISEKRGDLIFKIQQQNKGQLLTPYGLDLVVCRDITGPGKYFSRRGIEDFERKFEVKIGKSQLIHENAEEAYCESRLLDKDIVVDLSHASLGVIEVEIRTALLLGEEEFKNTLLLREKEKERILERFYAGIKTQHLSTRYDELLAIANSRQFRKETLALWTKVIEGVEDYGKIQELTMEESM